jgi:hypothetical protein
VRVEHLVEQEYFAPSACARRAVKAASRRYDLKYSTASSAFRTAAMATSCPHSSITAAGEQFGASVCHHGGRSLHAFLSVQTRFRSIRPPPAPWKRLPRSKRLPVRGRLQGHACDRRTALRTAPAVRSAQKASGGLVTPNAALPGLFRLASGANGERQEPHPRTISSACLFSPANCLKLRRHTSSGGRRASRSVWRWRR